MEQSPPTPNLVHEVGSPPTPRTELELNRGRLGPARNSELSSEGGTPAARFVDECFEVRATTYYAQGVPRRPRATSEHEIEFSVSDDGGIARPVAISVSLLTDEDEMMCSVARYTVPFRPAPLVPQQEYRIQVSWRPMPRGGVRPRLHCLMCGKSCDRLLLDDDLHLVCAECGGFRQRARYDPDGARRLQAKEMRGTLGPPAKRGGLPTRPAGMHRRTFEKKLARLAKLEAKSD